MLTDKGIDFIIPSAVRFGDYYEAVDTAKGRTYQEMYDRCLGTPHGVFRDLQPGGRKRIEILIFAILWGRRGLSGGGSKLPTSGGVKAPN